MLKHYPQEIGDDVMRVARAREGGVALKLVANARSDSTIAF